MDREKGIAYCGLACAICSKNSDCAGCRNEGCEDRDWCKNYKCCKTNGFAGCWECGEFPCRGSMLDTTRIRAFAIFVKRYGTDRLLECLERNEKAGIVYHYPGELSGDYDTPDSEEGILDMIMNGRSAGV